MNLKVIDDTIFSEEERLESLMQRRLGNRIRHGTGQHAHSVE